MCLACGGHSADTPPACSGRAVYGLWILLVAVDCVFALLNACKLLMQQWFLESEKSQISCQISEVNASQPLALLSWPLFPSPCSPDQCDSHILSRMFLVNSGLGRLEGWSHDGHVRNRATPQPQILGRAPGLHTSRVKAG